MDEKDLRKIPETAYLTAENAHRYRAILSFCYRRHEHMQTFVYPEEILRELTQTSFFAAYTAEQLEQDLAQLVAWNNLTQHQETRRARSIADFKRKTFRYQCTPYTVEIERMVERLKNLGEEFGGSLETTQFDRLLRELERFLLHGAELSAEELNQTWEDLRHYFHTLVENASDYLAHLRSAKVEERMQTTAFLAYKDMFTQYLRSFVLGLQRAALRVRELLDVPEAAKAQERAKIKQLFQTIAGRQALIHALEQKDSAARTAELLEEFGILRTWFLGRAGERESELAVLERETVETIRRITRFAQRIAAARQTQRSRKNDYLALAEQFLACADVREAAALASVAFGARDLRHFFADAPQGNINFGRDLHQKIETLPPSKISLVRHTRGGGGRRRGQPMQEHAFEKARALALYQKEQQKMQRTLASLAEDGVIDFGKLPVLSADVRRQLLLWVDRCLAQSGAVALENGQRMRLANDWQSSGRVTVTFEDGTLSMPHFRLLVENGRAATGGANGAGEAGEDGGA